jgi:hypothetical protein
MRRIVLILLPLLLTAARGQDCIVGNTQGLFGLDTGWVSSGASYAQYTQPMSGGCDCETGFLVEEIRVSLHLEAGAGVTVRALLYESDDTTGCDVPSLVLDTSEAVHFAAAPATGVYEIAVPCEFVCAVMWYRYFLAVEITALSGTVDLPFTSHNTGVPDKQAPGDPCTAYRDAGAGWEDMIGAGFGGGLPITAAVSCCGDPIEGDIDTWGEVKSLYR